MTDFLAVAVENLHDMKVWYNGLEYKWEEAYWVWESHNYKKKFDLFGTCIMNIYAWRAYIFRTYTNDSMDEAHLVQNFIKHFNQCRMKDISAPKDSYNKRQIGQVVFDLVPDIGFHLFDFMWDCGVYMDFTMLRTYFRWLFELLFSFVRDNFLCVIGFGLANIFYLFADYRPTFIYCDITNDITIYIPL